MFNSDNLIIFDDLKDLELNYGVVPATTADEEEVNCFFKDNSNTSLKFDKKSLKVYDNSDPLEVWCIANLKKLKK